MLSTRNSWRLPECGHPGHCKIHTRSVYQCHRCHRQTSVTSGTIFEYTKLPLTTWFLGMYLLTQSKNGTSVLSMKRQLGIGYNAAWRMKHKLLQVMKDRDDSQPLCGHIQIDDVYWAASIRKASEAAERQVKHLLWQPYKRMRKGALSR